MVHPIYNPPKTQRNKYNKRTETHYVYQFGIFNAECCTLIVFRTLGKRLSNTGRGRYATPFNVKRNCCQYVIRWLCEFFRVDVLTERATKTKYGRLATGSDTFFGLVTRCRCHGWSITSIYTEMTPTPSNIQLRFFFCATRALQFQLLKALIRCLASTTAMQHSTHTSNNIIREDADVKWAS